MKRIGWMKTNMILNEMSETIKKNKGKCIPLVIDDEVRARIKSFTNMLENMIEDYGMDSPQAKTINIILHKLDAYDRNFIIAYYEYGESPSDLGKMFGVSPSVIVARVKRIKKTIKSWL